MVSYEYVYGRIGMKKIWILLCLLIVVNVDCFAKTRTKKLKVGVAKSSSEASRARARTNTASIVEARATTTTSSSDTSSSSTDLRDTVANSVYRFVDDGDVYSEELIYGRKYDLGEFMLSNVWALYQKNGSKDIDEKFCFNGYMKLIGISSEGQTIEEKSERTQKCVDIEPGYTYVLELIPATEAQLGEAYPKRGVWIMRSDVKLAKMDFQYQQYADISEYLNEFKELTGKVKDSCSKFYKDIDSLKAKLGWSTGFSATGALASGTATGLGVWNLKETADVTELIKSNKQASGDKIKLSRENCDNMKKEECLWNSYKDSVQKYIKPVCSSGGKCTPESDGFRWEWQDGDGNKNCDSCNCDSACSKKCEAICQIVKTGVYGTNEFDSYFADGYFAVEVKDSKLNFTKCGGGITDSNTCLNKWNSFKNYAGVTTSELGGDTTNCSGCSNCTTAGSSDNCCNFCTVKTEILNKLPEVIKKQWNNKSPEEIASEAVVSGSGNLYDAYNTSVSLNRKITGNDNAINTKMTTSNRLDTAQAWLNVAGGVTSAASIAFSAAALSDVGNAISHIDECENDVKNLRLFYGRYLDTADARGD